MAKSAEHDIPVAYLRECFDADLEVGALTWRERPREHFASKQPWLRCNTLFARKLAGSLTNEGYLQVGLTFAGRYRALLAHRVIFALTHGQWPPDQIDHESGARSDTASRICGSDQRSELPQSENQPQQQLWLPRRQLREAARQMESADRGRGS